MCNLQRLDSAILSWLGMPLRRVFNCGVTDWEEMIPALVSLAVSLSSDPFDAQWRVLVARGCGEGSQYWVQIYQISTIW